MFLITIVMLLDIEPLSSQVPAPNTLHLVGTQEPKGEFLVNTRHV
jgi:hypothetical protein